MQATQSRIIVVFAAALIGLCGVVVTAADPAKEKGEVRAKVSIFMRAKLTNSQNVIEGLATENYDLIEAGAARMLLMSKATEWRVGDRPQYKQDTVEFVNACKDLIAQSKAKNIEGATLAYLQLTMNCVECHKHVRANNRRLETGLPR